MKITATTAATLDDDASLDEAASTEEGSSRPGLTLCGKAAGRPRSADKEARLLSLLHTAGALFLEKGYSKVSLEMIAREAHVAVRTIYVKFGGKAGLLNAVIADGRAHFFAGMTDMEADARPLHDVLHDFALRFLTMVSAPAFVNLHRMVVAEAQTTPELAETFFQAGPLRTREELMRFFARPDIRSQLRPDIPLDTLALHLPSCLLGDSMSRMLFPTDQAPTAAELQQRAELGLDLFLRGVLR